MVLKELILNSFYFGRVWWSWKNWFWTVSTLGGWGGLERTDFEQFLLWEDVIILKELILNSFYFGRVWWSWKNWFWTDSFGGWEGMVVLKELILNSFYFSGYFERRVRRVWWSWKVVLKESWKNWFWTVSTLGGCGGLERTDFEQFLLWEGMVVLKEFILNRFYFGGCGGLERTDFEQFLLWEGVVVMKELILNSFLFRRVLVVKVLILNSFYFGRIW